MLNISCSTRGHPLLKDTLYRQQSVCTLVLLVGGDRERTRHMLADMIYFKWNRSAHLACQMNSLLFCWSSSLDRAGGARPRYLALLPNQYLFFFNFPTDGMLVSLPHLPSLHGGQRLVSPRVSYYFTPMPSANASTEDWVDTLCCLVALCLRLDAERLAPRQMRRIFGQPSPDTPRF